MQKSTLYLKPVQTGYPRDSDAAFVQRACGNSPSLHSHILYAWRNAVSPHMAVALEGGAVDDMQLVNSVAAQLRRFAAASGSKGAMALVETAGGVASPGPSGSLQVPPDQTMLLLLCPFTTIRTEEIPKPNLPCPAFDENLQLRDYGIYTKATCKKV